MFKNDNLHILKIENRVLVTNFENETMFSIPIEKYNKLDDEALYNFSRKISTNKNILDKSYDININTLYIILTEKCNLGCAFCALGCDNSTEMDSLELDINRLKNKLIDLIKQSNPRKVILTGGEPLIYGKLGEVIELLKEHTTAKIVLQSNGLLLNEEIIDRCLKDVDCIEISTSHYDEIEKLNISLDYLIKSGCDLSLSFLFDGNYNKLYKVVDLVLDRKIGFVMNFISGFGSAKLNDLNILSGKEKLKVYYNLATYLLNKESTDIEILNYIFFSGLKITKPCGAFGSILTVYPNGNIYPCHSTTESCYCIGNINEDNFDNVLKAYKKLIDSSKYKQKFVLDQNGICNDCEYIYHCGGYCLAKDYKENLSDCVLRKFWVDYYILYYDFKKGFRNNLVSFINYFESICKN